MKKLVLLALLVCAFTVNAQPGDKKPRQNKKELREKMKDWTPEQHAELRTKKMALHLDLNDAQQKKVYPIELAIVKKKLEMREAKTEKNATELFEAKKQILDEKLSIKKQYKEILTADQFKKWEKMHRRQKGKKQGKKANHGQ